MLGDVGGGDDVLVFVGLVVDHLEDLLNRLLVGPVVTKILLGEQPSYIIYPLSVLLLS